MDDGLDLAPREGFRLSTSQQRIAEALSRVSTTRINLASYYVGGIRVMEDADRVLGIFVQLVEKLASDDFMHWDFADIKAIIKTALEYGNDEARSDALRARDLLLKRGYSCLLNLDD